MFFSVDAESPRNEKYPIKAIFQVSWTSANIPSTQRLQLTIAQERTYVSRPCKWNCTAFF
jgi:hypothetical protein